MDVASISLRGQGEIHRGASRNKLTGFFCLRDQACIETVIEDRANITLALAGRCPAKRRVQLATANKDLTSYV